jgi:hypothetical protein
MTSPETIARPPSPLRLHALDLEDLSLLSALLQDALLRVGDIAFLPKEKRFALLAARFDWKGKAQGRLERCSAGVHFETVTAARYKGVARDRPDEMLELLAVLFEPGPPAPSGSIRLVFAGGAAILLEVENIEAQLSDLGPRWPVSSCPAHELDEDVGKGS